MLGSRWLLVTAECPDAKAAGIALDNHKSFPTPGFVPYITEMRANTKSGKLEVTATCMLHLPNSRKLSGLPNLYENPGVIKYPTYVDIPSDSSCLVSAAPCRYIVLFYFVLHHCTVFCVQGQLHICSCPTDAEG